MLDEKTKKENGQVGTFPSPTHSRMIFVLFSFKSYLNFQPITVRSARTAHCFNEDAQRPFLLRTWVQSPGIWAVQLSVLLSRLWCQCFRTKTILPICLCSILYNLLCASTIQTANGNKSMWTILGPFVICTARSLVHRERGCIPDLLHTQCATATLQEI